SNDRISSNELLQRSIKDLNEYNGWTDTYHLQEMDTMNNRIRYQMFYRGYPVYNSSGLAMIEQEWHDQEVIEYNRPLFSINDSFGGDEVELPSGKAIKSFLLENKSYELDKIQNIKIGYRLSFQDTTFYTL